MGGTVLAVLCSLSVLVGVLGGLVALLVGVILWIPHERPFPPQCLLLALLGVVLWVGGNWGHLMLLGRGSFRRGVLVQQQMSGVAPRD